MRYSDAAHVHTGNFYSRRPRIGGIYRLLGYVAILGVWQWHEHIAYLEPLLVILVVLWVSAWYLAVGTLWRSSLVAALILCAGVLSWQHLVNEVPANGIMVMAASP